MAASRQYGQAHAVNIAARCGLGGIEIGMGIDPKQAQFTPLGRARDRTDRKVVIAAQHKRRAPLSQDLGDLALQRMVQFHDRLKITQLLAWGWYRAGFGQRHRNIAEIFDTVPQALQPFA